MRKRKKIPMHAGVSFSRINGLNHPMHLRDFSFGLVGLHSAFPVVECDAVLWKAKLIIGKLPT